MISLEDAAAAGTASSCGWRNHAHIESFGMGQLAVGVDAQQFVDAADQVARIDRPVLHLFASGVRGADDLAALESAAGDHAEKTWPQWPRPPFHGASQCTLGVRPNSPPHQTMVLRAGRARTGPASSVARPLSSSGSFCRIDREVLLVRVPALIVDGDVRHPRSTRRRAIRHDCPNVLRP